ncbi:Serine/threonine-protein kinase EDR1 [Thalictrum thalictroides]|uniref:non-specific serine/threonine protein kinase n=1 Tax=Thalictrum thalictroides TaxID=46969 RepID=A0A7J6WQJ0_THATH|nr:Serine/threonine-protein kinase EDR1 [Thalictrum thalictroides]
MKNLLKKLHIMPNQSEDIDGSTSSKSNRLNDGSIEKLSPSRSSSPSHSEQKPSSGLSGWLNSVTNRHSPSPPSSSSVKRGDKRDPPSDSLSISGLDAALEAVRQDSESSNSRDPEVEEEYQIQMALEMSAREDPEAVQIEAVKQISLGSCPVQNTPAEVVAYRYWNYNALGYDDKILDGFYDLYGILAESTSEKMPSLFYLQGTPMSDTISWEAVLVNRAADANLIKLEQKALVMTVKSRSECLGFVPSDLVQELASLVAHYMGGPVGNPESMLKAWRDLSNSLRATLNSMVLPLGYLTIGLARHRALLFKVLADSVDIPCRLMKGRQYTGSEDVAMNIVRVDNGREYIVDLMAAPGTLIPSDAAVEEPLFSVNPFLGDVDCTHIASSSSGAVSSTGRFSEFGKLDKITSSENLVTVENDLDNRGIMSEYNNAESPKAGSQESSSNPDKCEVESKLSEDRLRVEKALVRDLPGRSNYPYTHARSPSWTEGISSPAVRRMKVKDVSQYMIDAAKENPHLAQKLHDVLLESGVVAPANLFSEIYTEQREASLIEEKNKIEDKDEEKKRRNGTRPKSQAELGPGYEQRGSSDREHVVGPEAEKNSDRSAGNDSAKSDIALDDVAEWEIPWEEITLGERIGLGSYGEVYRGDWHGTEVAVKKFLDQDISGDALEEFRSEVRIMKRLRHPNVVLFMGAITRAPNLSIVTEFLPRGSLYRLIHRPNSQLDERRRLRMALDVARGMNYLHNSTPVIVHRDLKSPNLLVDKNWVVKVCDFGLSRMKHNTFLSSRSTAGTAEWMAPEVLRNEPSDEKCDVYSFGVILWELSTMQQPWGGMNPMQVVGAVGFQHRRLDVPDDMDPVIADIIIKCWQTDPRLRPSFSEIMAALKPLQKPITSTQVPRPRVPISSGQEKIRPSLGTEDPTC